MLYISNSRNKPRSTIASAFVAFVKLVLIMTGDWSLFLRPDSFCLLFVLPLELSWHCSIISALTINIVFYLQIILFGAFCFLYFFSFTTSRPFALACCLI